jgi:hypothetical protein
VTTVLRRGDAALTLDEDEILGWGSEALVYGPAALPRLAAKVFHKPRPEHAARLGAMLAAPPAGEHFTWPLEPLRDDAGTVAGYLMPRVPADRFSIAELFQPRTRRTHAAAFTHRDLLRAGRDLAAALQALHDRGHVAGDLDEADILVGAGSRVTIRDTDSFQVRDPATGGLFRCTTGRPELTPPELQGIRFADVDRAPEHDRFGLAVLLFQLLMEGTHPFACVSPARGDAGTIAERIRDGEFPYAPMPRGECRPAPHAPPLELLDPAIRALFLRCFGDGHLHPTARPAASDWESALARAERSMRGCGIHPQHVFGAHLDACPWCERASLLSGRDAFPPIDDTIPPLPAPARARGPRTARVAPKSRKAPPAPAAAPLSAPAYTPAPMVLPAPAPVIASAPGPAEHRAETPPASPHAATPESGRDGQPRGGGNPFMGLALLLAVAGVIPPLRQVAWGLAAVSAVLGIVLASRWGGRGQMQLVGAAAVVRLTLFAANTPAERIEEWRRGRSPDVVAVTPRTGDARSAPAPRNEPPAVERTPEPRPEPEPEDPPARPKPAPEAAPSRSAPKSSPARPAPEPAPEKSAPKSTPARSTPKSAPRTAPKSAPRATPRPAPTTAPKAEPRRAPRPEPEPATTPRTAPRTAPRREPSPKPLPRVPAPRPAPRVAEEPRRAPSAPAGELAPIRGELAIARTLKNQGAYYDAGVTLRGVQQSTSQLAARYPGDRAVAELQQRARTLAAENRQACQAEASVLRSRGEPTPPCP